MASQTPDKFNSEEALSSYGKRQRLQESIQRPQESIEKLTNFPFVINGVAEKDIETLFFASMADFDVRTLLKLRLVSNRFKDAIDLTHGKKLWGQQSLMKAVKDNRLDICKLIVEHAQDKNPIDYEEHPLSCLWRNTILHEAAKRGHLHICQLIMDHVEEKNPKNYYGVTPLHEAAAEGHLDICQLIMDQVEEKNPKSVDGITPLHIAADKGHLDICRHIIDQAQVFCNL